MKSEFRPRRASVWRCRVRERLELLAMALAPAAADASTYRWQVDANGDWNDPGNWAVVEGPAGAGYPNLAGDVAVIENVDQRPRAPSRSRRRDDHDRPARRSTTPEQVIDRAAPAPACSSSTTLARTPSFVPRVRGDHLAGADPNCTRTSCSPRTVIMACDGDSGSITEAGGSRNVTKIEAAHMLGLPGRTTYTGMTTVAEGRCWRTGTDVAARPWRPDHRRRHRRGGRR